MSTFAKAARATLPVRRAAVAGFVALLAACGGGDGGGSPSEPPPPVVLAVSGALDPATPTLFTVSGTGFPGAVGSPVTVRLTASDGLALAACGDPVATMAGTRMSASTVEATLGTFALTRDVTASVTLEFADGVTAASAGPVVSLIGTLDDRLDQDLDGVLDDCDPKTYTFSDDTLDARPSATTPLDGPGQPALRVVDREGDRAAAFTSGGGIASERWDRGDADFPQQDITVYLDVDPAGGSMNLEFSNEGSSQGYAGASLIFQVQPSGLMQFYERQASSIVRNTPGPFLPDSGRVRLRLVKREGCLSEFHVDARVGEVWEVDVAVFDIADDRPYRGLETVATNYYGGQRAIRRMTIVREIPAAPVTLAKAPGRAMDWQVFQRGVEGTASIPLRLLYRLPPGGVAEVRVARSDSGEVLPGFEFEDHVFAVPPAAAGRIDLVLPSVPAGGNYDVVVRVRNPAGEVVGQQALTDIGVGDVYVAAGQSNMSGYSGTLVGADAPSPLSHLFHNDGRWKSAAEPMDDGLNQTDAISREHPACSCLLSFANEVAARTGVPVGIVPTSLGGTNLYAQWQRDATFPARRATLYGSMVARAKRACPTTPPRGLLWFQGESDALSGRTTAQYAADLQAFVAQARTDLGAPDLVFLCGQLGTYSAAVQPGWIGVQEAQRLVVAADPLAALVTAVDLPRADAIHFNVSGYRALGRRFARGARQRVHGQATDPTNDLVSLFLGADGTSLTLTYERAVVGGAASLFRATDASGELTITSAAASGVTVTLAFDRAMGAAGRLAYGYSNLPNDPWVKDAADASPVPCFDALVVTP